MAKIRIRLIMADGAEVRNPTELREHFDLEKVVEYYKNGMLLKWLRVRFFDKEADAVEALDENADDFQQRLCRIFDVEFSGNPVDVEEIVQRQERLTMLREITDEEEFIRNIDQVAFDQEDLADLLAEGADTVYLCGTYFVVPARCEKVTYIGINEPAVHIAGLEKGKSLSPDIHFKQVKLENFPSTEKIHSSLDMDWQECYINRESDTIPEGVKETDSVEAWLRRGYRELGLDESDEITIVAAPKLDGVALRGEIDFDNRINKPLLRGDEKKSILVKGLDGLKLSDGASISKTPFGCQFEAFVTYENLEKASEYLMKEEKIEKPYVSPRHAASGIINRLCGNPDNKLAKFLSFYPINDEDLDGSYLDRLDKIKQLGNVEVVRTRLLSGNLKNLLDRIELRFNRLNSQRASLPYAIDGLVLAFADDSHQDQLGRSGRTNKWQIALKFDPSSAVGEVKGIELSSGKKGFRTIQVVLKEPVSIDGVRYDHVPALSADIFEKFDLCEGDLIRIHRVGDVIPSISIEERKGGKKIELPKECPVCGEELIWEAKKLKCVNMWCKANLVGALLTFFNYANIKGIGDAEAETLVDSGLDTIEKIATERIHLDLGLLRVGYSLIFDHSKWESAGYTKESAERLQTAVLDALHNMWDYEFIGNRGIPGIGPETAKKVFMSIRKSDPDAVVKGSDLLAISLKESNFDKHVQYNYESVCSIALSFAEKMCKHSTPEHFANLKSVGHTGGNPSKEAKQLIRNLGWELVDGKKFDYLIVPSYNHESTKTKVAKEKGKLMFTEEDFVEEFSSDI